MDAAIDVARDEGAADLSLGTGEDDVAARAMYESLGFSNRESNGALNFFTSGSCDGKTPRQLHPIVKIA
jgi:ribosomal protein S18 acetylase RimI-like enzyme